MPATDEYTAQSAVLHTKHPVCIGPRSKGGVCFLWSQLILTILDHEAVEGLPSLVGNEEFIPLDGATPSPFKVNAACH